MLDPLVQRTSLHGDGTVSRADHVVGRERLHRCLVGIIEYEDEILLLPARRVEAFDLELKKVAKEFGKKFATGSSVTRVPSGGEEIVVQGDVSDEIEEFLLEKYKDIPEDNIELVDDKKKKPSG